MADATRFGLRPTLLIGLGGTGHKVLVRLKARYLDAYGEDIFRIIKLLSFDTADEGEVASRENGAFVQLDRGTELLHVGNVPTTRMLRNIDLHPTIKAWLPKNMPARAITAGAQQVRPMGRLAFFHHFRGVIQPNLEQAIRDLANIGQRGDIGEGATILRSQGINVFIITSICGGTGSGMFIDMAYLIRQLCMGQGLDENYCNVNGVLVLPQAFATVPNDAIRANAYAAFVELDYFTKGGNFSVQYPGNLYVDIHHRPFNICYLVDAVNERGQMLSGMTQLAPMMAEAIFLQTASQVGEAQVSVFDNVKSLDGLDQDYPSAYSGFGTASLVFPVNVIIDACASRYCRELLSSAMIGRAADASAVSEQLNAVVEKMRLSDDPLKVEMGRSERGARMRVELDGKTLEKTSHNDVVRVAIKQVQEEEDRNLNNRYQRQLEANLNKLKRELSQTLHQETNRIVNQPQLGLNVAIAFLQALDQQISTLVASFTEQRDTLDKQARQLETRNRRIQEALVEATSSFFIGRGRRVANARDNFINHHKTRMSALLNRNLLSLSLSLLAYISDDVVRVRLRELSTLKDKLQVAQEQLSARATELADGRSRALSPLTYEITDASDVERYYQQYTRQLTQELPRLFEEYGALHKWAPRSYEEIHDTLLNFGRSVFRRIRDIQIEQVIMDKRDQESADVRLQILRDDSIPFWNRDLTRMTDGGIYIETISVIGVPNTNSTIYKNVREGELPTSTHNHHAITVLTTRHGLTIYALQQLPDYQRRYQRFRERQIAPIHCFDEVLNTRWLKTIFAVALAFDIIQKDKERYSIHLPAKDKRRKPKIDLGLGLNKALHRFLIMPDHVSEVERLIDDHINQNGIFDAKMAIEQYIQQENSRSLAVRKIEQELKQLADDYTHEHLAT